MTKPIQQIADELRREEPGKFNLDSIDDYFVKDEYREGQKEAIEFALRSFNDGKKVVILECPTGSGKSAIGMTIADMVSRSYYLTVTKILQDQLINDFGDEIVELRGRGSYPCTYWDRRGQKLVSRKLISPSELAEKRNKYNNCANGFCRTKLNNHKNKFKCMQCFASDGPIKDGELSRLSGDKQYSECPYYEQVYQAITRRKVVMNFSSFLYQTQMTKRFDTPRNLMIIDECLHPHTRVQTECGNIPIGKLVNEKMVVRVASWNNVLKKVEYKPIARWLKRGKRLTFRVLAGNRVLYPTIDHKLYTPLGKKKLSELQVGDPVLVRQTEITEMQEQLVLGSLLGDANLHLVESKRISKRYINKGIRARVRFRHRSKQFEYLLWKHSILKQHAKTEPTLKQATGFTKMVASFSTNYNFYEIIKPTLIDCAKSPNNSWLDKINEFGLAVWFMDDGSTSSGTCRFNTHGFSRQENEILVKWLRSRWGIDSSIKQEKKKDGRIFDYITLTRESSRILINLISMYVPPFMRYKLPKCIDHELDTGIAINNPIAKRDSLLTKGATAVLTWPKYDKSIEEQVCSEISVQPIRLIEPYKETYNYDLEVEDNHNYFAGNTLVSNCHNVEPSLLDFVSLTVSDYNLQDHGIFIPQFENPYEYAVWFEDSQMHKLIYDVIKEAEDKENTRLVDDMARLLKKYKMFMEQVTDNNYEWVCEYEEKSANGKTFRSVTLRPVFATNFVQPLLFGYADRILMMSATVLDVNVVCRSLGLEREHIAAYRMKNRFPVENRPIYLDTVGKMTGGKQRMHEWAPSMTRKIDEIARKYQDEKGIIHTHNFAIMDYILKHANAKTKNRLLNQRDFRDKRDMLKAHAESDNTILIAPAMHEGIDLKEGLSRFQIICKVPYPNCFDDQQLARRVEIDRKYYLWLTALKIVQAYGRSIRSDDDHADTYILDESIHKFLKDTRKMIPSWFTDAIINQ